MCEDFRVYLFYSAEHAASRTTPQGHFIVCDAATGDIYKITSSADNLRGRKWKDREIVAKTDPAKLVYFESPYGPLKFVTLGMNKLSADDRARAEEAYARYLTRCPARSPALQSAQPA